MKYLVILVSGLMCGLVSTSASASEMQVLDEQDAAPLFVEAQQTGLVQMDDDELSATQGQALFNLEYLAAGDAKSPYPSSSNVAFYTLSMEAEVRLNANIKSLQLGCGGVNGDDKCDVDIQDVSFGCITNTAGTCITLPKTYANQPDGSAKTNYGAGPLTVSQEASGSIPTSPSVSTLKASNASGITTQGGIRDFVLNNPFFQFAVRNPDTAATREVIGLRIGAAQTSGPMSFGNLATFSGYLTGKANLDMQEMGKGRNPNDVAVTCGADTGPCKNPASWDTSNGQNTFGYTGDRTLGLTNDRACVTFICEQFRNLTVSFDGVQRNNLPVSVNGNRVTQAQVYNTELGAVVDEIVGSLDFVKSNGLPAGLIDIIKGLIQDQVKTKIKNQLATGLNTTVAALDNNTYVMPYNLNNVHQLEVDSNVFGIALSKEAIQYPGYVAAVPRGWSMYIPDGFTLNISEPTTRLVNSIVAGTGADGNIALLAAPYRNCYGTLKFC